MIIESQIDSIIDKLETISTIPVENICQSDISIEYLKLIYDNIEQIMSEPSYRFDHFRQNYRNNFGLILELKQNRSLALVYRGKGWRNADQIASLIVKGII